MAEVKVDFRFETRDAAKDMGKLADSVEDVAEELGDTAKAANRFDDQVDKVSDGLGNGAQKFRDTNDLIGGFADVVGLSLPPQAQMLMGFADMADGLGGLLAPALGKARGAMMLLNTTIAANPIGAAVVAIAALTAGFVIAYKKSETFREIVHGAMDAVGDAFDWVVSKGESLVDWFRKIGPKTADALGGIAKTISGPYRTAFNAISDAWNNTVGRLSFSVPDWVPGLGGKGWDVPDLPHFASGGHFNGGAMVVGENGPEVIHSSVPGTVIPNGRLTGGGRQVVEVRLTVDGGMTEMRDLIRKIVRVNGGTVEGALG